MENKNLLILFYVKAIEGDNEDYELKYTRSFFNLNTLVKNNEEVNLVVRSAGICFAAHRV